MSRLVGSMGFWCSRKTGSYQPLMRVGHASSRPSLRPRVEATLTPADARLTKAWRGRV